MWRIKYALLGLVLVVVYNTSSIYLYGEDTVIAQWKEQFNEWWTKEIRGKGSTPIVDTPSTQTPLIDDNDIDLSSIAKSRSKDVRLEKSRIEPIWTFFSNERECVNAQIEMWNVAPHNWGDFPGKGKAFYPLTDQSTWFRNKKEFLAWAWRQCKEKR